MDELIEELMTQGEGSAQPFLIEEEQQLLAQIPMRILSSDQKVYGAACILYPEVLEEISEKAEANLYILPSSVHEVILLPDSGNEDPQALKSMIYEVNRTQLEPEEVLSDNLYYFDRFEKNVRII